MEVMKAMKTMPGKKSAAAAEKNRVGSRAYHAAKKQYADECVAKKRVPKPAEATRRAREAYQLAVADLA